MLPFYLYPTSNVVELTKISIGTVYVKLQARISFRQSCRYYKTHDIVFNDALFKPQR